MKQPAESSEARLEMRCMLGSKRWEYAVHEKNEDSVTTEA